MFYRRAEQRNVTDAGCKLKIFYGKAKKMSWECSHLVDKKCNLLKKECSPGQKGCVLYGKAKFANSVSSEAYEKRAKTKNSKN
jgi:hypothetical protein